MAQDEFPEHIACSLAYFFFFFSGILLLTMEPYSANRTIRLHAWQSIILTGIFMVAWFVCAGLTKVSGPFLAYLLGVIMTTAWFAFLFVWIYAMYSAYKGLRLEIPVISKLAEKFA